MSAPVSKDLLIINAAAFLRSFTFGLTGVVLGIYLFRAGLSSFNIGMVVAAGLVGSALATIGVTAKADRAGRRRTLVVLSLLGAIGALALAFTPAVPVLLAMAFVGMLNGTGTDRSAAFSLEQAIIPGLVPDASRTWGLAWYNVVLDTAGSLGALAAASAPAPATLASPSAARLVPHSLSWMRLPRSSWSNPLPLRLCCSRGLQISDGGSPPSHLTSNQKGRHKTGRSVFP